MIVASTRYQDEAGRDGLQPGYFMLCERLSTVQRQGWNICFSARQIKGRRIGVGRKVLVRLWGVSVMIGGVRYAISILHR